MSDDYGFDYDHAILTTEGSQVANHLLRELMVAMGKPLFARPQSPHEVWLECLDEISGFFSRRDTGC